MNLGASHLMRSRSAMMAAMSPSEFVTCVWYARRTAFSLVSREHATAPGPTGVR